MRKELCLVGGVFATFLVCIYVRAALTLDRYQLPPCNRYDLTGPIARDEAFLLLQNFLTLMSTIIVTVVGVFVLEKNAQTALLFAGIAFLAVLIEINFAKEDLKNIPGDSVWWFFPHSWYAAKGLFLLFFLCIIVCYSTLGNRNQKTLGAMIALLGVVVLVGWYTEAEWITNENVAYTLL